MSKVRIKYIMELIFIFIFPLLFVLCNVSIENTFVYDNEGNYQTSERSISYTPIAYTTETITNPPIDTEVFLSSITSYSDFINYNIVYDNGGYCEISMDYITFYIDDGLINVWSEEEPDGPIDEDVSYSWSWLRNYVTNIYEEVETFSIVSNDTLYIIESVPGSTYIKNSPIVDLKNILADVIQIDSTNATYNVVFDYTCLWFIMFIIWHLVYMFVDFLLHFWRKEEK